jgi:hypothetical protein
LSLVWGVQELGAVHVGILFDVESAALPLMIHHSTDDMTLIDKYVVLSVIMEVILGGRGRVVRGRVHGWRTV